MIYLFQVQQQKSYEAELKNGYEVGLNQAQQTLSEYHQTFEAIFSSFDQALKLIDDDVIQSITQLAIAISKQIIRRELQINSEQVVSVVREAIKLLPLDKSRLVVHLNPSDIEVVQKVFNQDETDHSFSLSEDPSIQRGGCKLSTEDSIIDATIDSQVAQIAAKILGSQTFFSSKRGLSCILRSNISLTVNKIGLMQLIMYQDVMPSFDFTVEGRLTRLVGLTIEAQGCQVNIGGRCLIISPNGQKMEAEVVGFSGSKSYLMPIENMQGAVPGARVVPTKDNHRLPVGYELLGRVVDGAGQPLDKNGPIHTNDFRDLEGSNINPI